MKKINIYQYSTGRISYRILIKKINSHREIILLFNFSSMEIIFRGGCSARKKEISN